MRPYTPLYSRKWDSIYSADRAVGRQDYLNYLAAEEALEAHEKRTEALAALLTPQALETEGVKALLEGAKKDGEALRLALTSAKRRLPNEYRAMRTSELIDKVFGTPELLEHIFTFVSVPDLLRLYSVSRTFFNTIEGSTTLQRRLGLQADMSCHMHLPAEHLIYHSEGMDMMEMFYSSSHFGAEHEVDNDTLPIKINVCTYGLRNKGAEQIDLRPLGERCKKMLIIQPPIKEMGVYLQCCTPNYRAYRDRQTEPPTETITNERGITTEQVWQAVAKAQKEHRLCPDASAYDHDADGFVQLRMTIEGQLKLKEDDPTLKAKNRRREESREEDREFQGREVRFRPYITAKQAARDNGEPIPTYAEFLERQAVQDG